METQRFVLANNINCVCRGCAHNEGRNTVVGLCLNHPGSRINLKHNCPALRRCRAAPQTLGSADFGHSAGLGSAGIGHCAGGRQPKYWIGRCCGIVRRRGRGAQGLRLRRSRAVQVSVWHWADRKSLSWEFIFCSRTSHPTRNTSARPSDLCRTLVFIIYTGNKPR